MRSAWHDFAEKDNKNSAQPRLPKIFCDGTGGEPTRGALLINDKAGSSEARPQQREHNRRRRAAPYMAIVRAEASSDRRRDWKYAHVGRRERTRQWARARTKQCFVVSPRATPDRAPPVAVLGFVNRPRKVRPD